MIFSSSILDGFEYIIKKEVIKMIEKFNAVLGIVNFILLVYLIYSKKK